MVSATYIDWDKFQSHVPIGCVIKTPVWCDDEGGVYGGDVGVLLEYQPFGCIDHPHSDTLLLFPDHVDFEVNLHIQEINSFRDDYIDARGMMYLIDGEWLTFDQVMGRLP